jgi:hypothetical protein
MILLPLFPPMLGLQACATMPARSKVIFLFLSFSKEGFGSRLRRLHGHYSSGHEKKSQCLKLSAKVDS